MRREDFIGEGTVDCCKKCVVNSCCSEICDEFREIARNCYVKKILDVGIDCTKPSMSISIGFFELEDDSDTLQLVKKEDVYIEGDELEELMKDYIDLKSPIKMVDAIGESVRKILQYKSFYKGGQ